MKRFGVGGIGCVWWGCAQLIAVCVGYEGAYEVAAVAFGSGGPPSDDGVAEVPIPSVEVLLSYSVSGVAFIDEGNGVQGVVMVTKRAKVGGEDEVGLVALAREEAVHPLVINCGEPRGFEKEVITKGPVNVVVLIGWKFVFCEFRGYFAGEWSLVNGQLCGSCGEEKIIEMGGARFGDTVRRVVAGEIGMSFDPTLGTRFAQVELHRKIDVCTQLH